MKTIITILISLTTTFFYAQEQIVSLTELGEINEQENVTYYYKDIDGDLNKFVGTWKYQDSNKELIVIFHSNEHYDLGGTFYDEIYAKFKYTENGNLIYNNLLDNSDTIKNKISGGSIWANSTNKISLAYNEPTDIPYRGEWSPRLKLEYLPCNTLGCSPQLKWDLYWGRASENDPWPFKIPSHMVLTKQ